MRTIRTLLVLAAAGALVTALSGPAIADRLDGSTAGGAPLSAALDGHQEVDNDGNPDQGDLDATGFAITTINPGLGQACWELTHDLDPLPFAFHIHVGGAGVNGPIVVNYFTQPGAVVPASGCVDIDRALARDILANPAGYYFNVHNEPFPAGAIRGQLSASSR
jgi:hypothetical protein